MRIVLTALAGWMLVYVLSYAVHCWRKSERLAAAGSALLAFLAFGAALFTFYSNLFEF